ncbi:MAG: M15 family metallopeptidase [Desulfobacterales bacterium]|nr:M15 family metallopeptidase [Desulfobacterales bacterium]
MTPFISTLLLKLCRFNLHTFPLIALFIASTIITGCLPSAHTATSDPLPEKVKQQTDTTETITLDGVLYEIPAPWAGHKLEAPTLTYDSFRKIPDAHTKEGSKIYVLAKAHDSLIKMLLQAEKDGVHLQAESGYRSENYQRKIFRRMLAKGRTFDDIVRYVAPPGYSQHMFGTAVDFYPSNWRFAKTPQYEWLEENAHLFHFEQTYPEFNKLQMPWEAWHWNYIGK